MKWGAVKKYKLGFDAWGLILFLVIMIPNFIWFAVPAPNDILRTDSITEVFDTIASICQVLMVAALCLVINREREKFRFTPLIIGVCACAALYFTSWVFYYNGVANAAVILGLTLPPCLTFMLFALNRKNYVAVIPCMIFTVCHLIYGIVNFIV